MNFNISHEGDVVVLATETNVLVGVDVCAALHLAQWDKDEVYRSFRGSFADNEWQKMNFRNFRIFWSSKEAFVKARGDGLEFDLSRADFSDGFRLDGVPQRQWHFDVEHLDENHVVTTCRGPFNAVVDAYGDFRRTLPSTDYSQIHAPRPSFTFLEVPDLLPAPQKHHLLQLRRGHFSDDDPLPEEEPLSLGKPSVSDNNLFKDELKMDSGIHFLPSSDHPDLSTLRVDGEQHPVCRCTVS